MLSLLVILLSLSIRISSTVKSECFPGDFYCRLSDKCIPMKLRCDGISHCPWSEDERRCSCVKWCDDRRRCILEREICDGFEHCKDKSDEANCSVISCSESRFPCTVQGTKRCLDLSVKCDLNKDCDDGSDEDSCPSLTTSLSSDSKAESATIDCQGNSQNRPEFCPVTTEADSKITANCPLSAKFASVFKMDLAVSSSVHKCNGILDCPLGEDEANCAESGITCSSGYFKCKNANQCIPSSQVCDALNHCSDGSDETVGVCLKKHGEYVELDAYWLAAGSRMKCKVPKLSSTSEKDKEMLSFPYSRFYISTDKACDGNKDCPFGDDEDNTLGCEAQNEVRLVTQKCEDLSCDPVSTKCIETPVFGLECICKPGFKRIAESLTRCVDIDECSLGICSHSCENLLGSFACGCPEGFHLSQSSCRHCEAAEDAQEPYFLFSTPKNIYRIDRATKMSRVNLFHAEVGKIRPFSSGGIPFDYSRLDDLLIFYDWGAIKAKLTESAQDPWVLLNVNHDITWLVYDELNNNVYYNNGNQPDKGYFWRVFYVGVLREKAVTTKASRSSLVKTLIRNNLPNLYGSNLVLYPELGIMFYTIYDSKKVTYQVVSSALNGDNLSYMNWKFVRIVSMSIERSAGFLYILDAGQPGLAQVPILTESSPATIGKVDWIEERPAFFGPQPFIRFSSAEFSSEFYVLSGEFGKNEDFRISLRTFNKSSTLAAVRERSLLKSSAPVIQTVSPLLLPNTSFFLVKSTTRPLQLDVCFHERQHRCETYHLCLPQPPYQGETSAFTRAVCECPENTTADCERVELPIRSNFMPPGKPLGSMEEFKSRPSCANILKRTYQPLKLNTENDDDAEIGVNDDEFTNFGQIWSTNLTAIGEENRQKYDALRSHPVSQQGVATKNILSFSNLIFMLSIIFLFKMQ